MQYLFPQVEITLHKALEYEQMGDHESAEVMLGLAIETEVLAITNINNPPVAYVFEECKSCGAPMRDRRVSTMPSRYDYQEGYSDGDNLPVYCIGTSSHDCYDCSVE